MSRISDEYLKATEPQLVKNAQWIKKKLAAVNHTKDKEDK